MAVRSILRIGDPRLRQVAEPVDAYDTPDLHELIEDMFDTMAAADGAGLAATQIGVIKQVMIFGVESTPRYPDIEPVPTTVLINPEFSVLSDEVAGFWEGCLSVPDLRGLVPRPREVRVDYLGLDGQAESITADGFLSTVLQHELDHLEGLLFIDRMRDMTKLATIEDYRKYWLQLDDDDAGIDEDGSADVDGNVDTQV